MRIQLKRIDLKSQKITEWRNGFIDLEEKHFRYFIDFTANEKKEDALMPWKEGVINYYDIIADKNCISAFQIDYDNEDNLYTIGIISAAFGYDMKLFFKSKTKADEVYKQLIEWRFPGVSIDNNNTDSNGNN